MMKNMRGRKLPKTTKSFQGEEKQIPQRSVGEVLERLGETFIYGFFSLLGKFGLAGTLILILYWFLNNNASSEQKAEIIDTWFLLKATQTEHLVILVTIFLFGMITLGQWLYYKSKVSILEQEISRLSAEKSAYQEIAIGKKLYHTKKRKVKK